MKRPVLVVILVLGFLCAAAQEVSAQLRVYMYVDGIEGPVTDPTHPSHSGWIEGLALRQSLTQNGEVANGCGVEVVKALDSAGPKLWLVAAQGMRLRQVTIKLITSEKRLPVTIYQIWLDMVTIRSITTEGDNAFVERLSLAAGSVRMTYTPQLPDGSTGTPVSAFWSCIDEGTSWP